MSTAITPIKTNYISTIEMTDEVWAEKRNHGIGGSDVAAILGLSDYKTAVDVYLEKIGEKEPVKPNPKMIAGNMMEDIIASWWASENGFRIQRDNKIRIHPKYNIFMGNIDRLIIDNGHGRGTGILECKNTTSFAFKQWENEGLPKTHFCQTLYYMGLSGHKWGEVAVLVDGWNLKSIPIEFDKEFIELMYEQLLDFWYNHVMVHRPPLARDENDVKSLFKRVNNEKTLDATSNETLIKACHSLAALKSELKKLESKEKSLEAEIKIAMMDSTILTAGEEILATWKQNKDGKKFDFQAFQEDHPEIFSKYVKPSPGVRVFLLKVKGDK